MQVARLMASERIQGAKRPGKPWGNTTTTGPEAQRPADGFPQYAIVGRRAGSSRAASTSPHDIARHTRAARHLREVWHL